jgi:hypothetical protein
MAKGKIGAVTGGVGVGSLFGNSTKKWNKTSIRATKDHSNRIVLNNNHSNNNSINSIHKPAALSKREISGTGTCTTNSSASTSTSSPHHKRGMLFVNHDDEEDHVDAGTMAGAAPSLESMNWNSDHGQGEGDEIRIRVQQEVVTLVTAVAPAHTSDTDVNHAEPMTMVDHDHSNNDNNSDNDDGTHTEGSESVHSRRQSRSRRSRYTRSRRASNAAGTGSASASECASASETGTDTDASRRNRSGSASASGSGTDTDTDASRASRRRDGRRNSIVSHKHNHTHERDHSHNRHGNDNANDDEDDTASHYTKENEDDASTVYTNITDDDDDDDDDGETTETSEKSAHAATTPTSMTDLLPDHVNVNANHEKKRYSKLLARSTPRRSNKSDVRGERRSSHGRRSRSSRVCVNTRAASFASHVGNSHGSDSESLFSGDASSTDHDNDNDDDDTLTLGSEFTEDTSKSHNTDDASKASAASRSSRDSHTKNGNVKAKASRTTPPLVPRRQRQRPPQAAQVEEEDWLDKVYGIMTMRHPVAYLLRCGSPIQVPVNANVYKTNESSTSERLAARQKRRTEKAMRQAQAHPNVPPQTAHMENMTARQTQTKEAHGLLSPNKAPQEHAPHPISVEHAAGGDTTTIPNTNRSRFALPTEGTSPLVEAKKKIRERERETHTTENPHGHTPTHSQGGRIPVDIIGHDQTGTVDTTIHDSIGFQNTVTKRQMKCQGQSEKELIQKSRSTRSSLAMRRNQDPATTGAVAAAVPDMATITKEATPTPTHPKTTDTRSVNVNHAPGGAASTRKKKEEAAVAVTMITIEDDGHEDAVPLTANSPSTSTKPHDGNRNTSSITTGIPKTNAADQTHEHEHQDDTRKKKTSRRFRFGTRLANKANTNTHVSSPPRPKTGASTAAADSAPAIVTPVSSTQQDLWRSPHNDLATREREQDPLVSPLSSLDSLGEALTANLLDLIEPNDIDNTDTDNIDNVKQSHAPPVLSHSMSSHEHNLLGGDNTLLQSQDWCSGQVVDIDNNHTNGGDNGYEVQVDAAGQVRTPDGTVLLYRNHYSNTPTKKSHVSPSRRMKKLYQKKKKMTHQHNTNVSAVPLVSDNDDDDDDASFLSLGELSIASGSSGGSKEVTLLPRDDGDDGANTFGAADKEEERDEPNPKPIKSKPRLKKKKSLFGALKKNLTITNGSPAKRSSKPPTSPSSFHGGLKSRSPVRGGTKSHAPESTLVSESPAPDLSSPNAKSHCSSRTHGNDGQESSLYSRHAERSLATMRISNTMAAMTQQRRESHGNHNGNENDPDDACPTPLASTLCLQSQKPRPPKRYYSVGDKGDEETPSSSLMEDKKPRNTFEADQPITTNEKESSSIPIPFQRNESNASWNMTGKDPFGRTKVQSRLLACATDTAHEEIELEMEMELDAWEDMSAASEYAPAPSPVPLLRVTSTVSTAKTHRSSACRGSAPLLATPATATSTALSNSLPGSQFSTKSTTSASSGTASNHKVQVPLIAMSRKDSQPLTRVNRSIVSTSRHGIQSGRSVDTKDGLGQPASSISMKLTRVDSTVSRASVRSSSAKSTSTSTSSQRNHQQGSQPLPLQRVDSNVMVMATSRSTSRGASDDEAPLPRPRVNSNVSRSSAKSSKQQGPETRPPFPRVTTGSTASTAATGTRSMSSKSVRTMAASCEHDAIPPREDHTHTSAVASNRFLKRPVFLVPSSSQFWKSHGNQEPRTERNRKTKEVEQASTKEVMDATGSTGEKFARTGTEDMTREEEEDASASPLCRVASATISSAASPVRGVLAEEAMRKEDVRSIVKSLSNASHTREVIATDPLLHQDEARRETPPLACKRRPSLSLTRQSSSSAKAASQQSLLQDRSTGVPITTTTKCVDESVTRGLFPPVPSKSKKKSKGLFDSKRNRRTKKMTAEQKDQIKDAILESVISSNTMAVERKQTRDLMEI